MPSRRRFLEWSSLVAAAAVWRPTAAINALSTDGCGGNVLSDGAVARFRAQIAGEVVLSTDAAYDAARVVFSRRFDPRPLMIVRAANESDVVRTIVFCRTHGLRLAPRSGGHSYVGASGGSGVVLDLRALRTITALGAGRFSIGAGARLAEIYGTLRCQGGWTLPCGSCDSVGIGGIAQGGGFGYLQCGHGLTCDRVRSLRVVLADGTVVDADSSSHPALFWALRGGGGGNFGVVTRLEVEAVPFATIRVAGWRWPVAAADDALARMHELLAGDAIERHALAGTIFSIDTSTAQPSVLGIVFSTAGAAGAAAVREQLVVQSGLPAIPGTDFSFDAETPACDPAVGRTTALFRAKSAISYEPPASDTGARIAAWLAVRAADPAFSLSEYASVNILALRGAVADVAANATAFPHRAALSETQFLGYWNTPSAAKDCANANWLKGVYGEVFPRLSIGGEGCYVNYADDDLTEAEWTTRCYGANLPGLIAVKNAYDPDGFFRGPWTLRGS